jgi:hypothetical protein
MTDYNLGDPIPWEQLNPQEIPIPIRERVSPRDMELAQPFPSQPDSEILEQLTELAKSLGSGGSGSGGNGGKKTGVSAPMPDDNGQGPTDPIDALAWYLSFRSTGQWGVFITRTGLLNVGSFFVRHGASPKDAYQIARYLLQNHETCHFLIDRAVLTLEMAIGHATQSHPPMLWLEYKRRHLPYSQLEEAVCNAFAYRMADASAKKFVRAFMERQPAGYSDVSFDQSNAGTFLGSFQQSESQLLSDYQVAQRTDEGMSRVLGLNGLMQYRTAEKGTKGDLYFTRPGKKTKEKLPIFLV